MNTRIELRVQGLTNSQIQSGAYALILAEMNGPRRIPIIVGTAEAQSIAIALENIIPPRPLTHDLFASFTTTLGLTLAEVFIYKFEDGVFYSELLFKDETREFKLDSRTSDAIAIALRVKSRIFTSEEIVRECGVVLEEGPESFDEEEEEEDDLFADEFGPYLTELEPEDLEGEEELVRWLGLLGRDELEKRLHEAVVKENYEYAKMYRDEIKKRDEEDNFV